MSNSFEDDLLSELLGEVSKPYEVIPKRNYDYVTLESGFGSQVDSLKKELSRLADQHKLEASRETQSGQFDIQKLIRPIFFHLRSASAAQAKDLDALKEIQNATSDTFKSFYVFPHIDNLGALPGTTGRDLKSVLRLSGIVPPGSADPEIAEVLCKSFKELFEIQLKTTAKFVGGAFKQPGVVHKDCFSGSLDMEGSGVSLSIIVTCEKGMMAPALSKMTGLDPSKLSQEAIQNTPSEFVNIIAGSARARLNSAGYSLRSPGLPKMITPEAQSNLSSPDGSISIELQVSSELGNAWLEIRFYN
jgi:hypothetical protein